MWITAAFAKSWCAIPVAAHEWGVAVLPADGRAVEKPALPSWFHHQASLGAMGPPVRTGPADGGERSLPVLHLRSVPHGAESFDIGLEVGFTHGAATAWYPGTNDVTPAAQANSAVAAEARRKLLAYRASVGPRDARQDPGTDPTRQLHWDRLELTATGVGEPTDAAWVLQARALDTLWVNWAGESERFVFYEAETRERSAVRIVEQGAQVVLENTGDWDVHDVALFDGDRVVQVPRLPAGKTATLPWTPRAGRAQERNELTARWTMAPLQPPRMDTDCVMMEDPLKPVETASDHRLYADELGVLWSAWEARMLSGDRHLIYREDPAALDAAMPLSIYSDMRHWLALSRLGVVLVEGL